MSDQPVFNIKRLYLKKAILDQPNSPALLLKQERPAVELSLNVNIEPITYRPNLHEITVDAIVHAKINGEILFQVDCKQSGLFEIFNVTDAQLAAILNVVCPQIIYPYLRSNMTDLIVRGGFTPVHIDEINFHALYEKRKAQQREQGHSTQVHADKTADSEALIRAALQRAQELSVHTAQAASSAQTTQAVQAAQTSPAVQAAQAAAQAARAARTTAPAANPKKKKKGSS
jgi:preprotein translocase subunit SecB